MKRISLIIATFNAEKTLERCLNSIISQKNALIELIIIDGLSKDCTNNIINKYEQFIDYRISEKDNGLYDAWNKGIKVAHGEWIMFLGADDIVVPDFFKYYLEYLDSNNLTGVDIISAKANIVDHSGNIIYVYGEPYKWDIFRKRMNISHGTTLHNRLLFKEIGFFNTQVRICADYEFLLRKKLNARFCNRIMIHMEFGGVSNTYKGIIDSYSVRTMRKSISPFANFMILIRGIISFTLKQGYRKLTAKQI